MLELLGRAVTALESLADSTKRLADTQDKSIGLAKKMVAASVSMMDKAPEDIKEDPGYQLCKSYVDELAEAINEL